MRVVEARRPDMHALIIMFTNIINNGRTSLTIINHSIVSFVG
jgi:hypothetical protein